MVKLKPEFLVKNGKREFVILTARDFDRVIEALEDAEDLRILRESRRRNAKSPTFTLEEVKQRLGISSSRGRKASRPRNRRARATEGARAVSMTSRRSCGVPSEREWARAGPGPATHAYGGGIATVEV